MSSRWPRPIGIMESIALIPVWIGSFTLERSITPYATRSIGMFLSVAIGPLPSIASPSAFTTRPTIAGPTGTESRLPVRRTCIPSFTKLLSPKITTLTVSSSRFKTSPTSAPSCLRVSWRGTPLPVSKITISIICAFKRPSISAIPSPTETTTPTSCGAVVVSRFSISFLIRSMMAVLMIIYVKWFWIDKFGE